MYTFSKLNKVLLLLRKKYIIIIIIIIIMITIIVIVIIIYAKVLDLRIGVIQGASDWKYTAARKGRRD